MDEQQSDATGSSGFLAGWLDTGRDVVHIAKRLSDVRGNVRTVRALLDLTAPDRPLGQLLASDNEQLWGQVVGEQGLVERLTADGGTLDQIESLNSAIASVRPVLEELGPSVRAVAASPLGDLASLFPTRRRRPDGPSTTSEFGVRTPQVER